VKNSGTKNSNELAEDRTELAIKRTLMGADRTLMAWVRTALSMISFGFTIYKVMQGFQESSEHIIGQRYEPRTVGLFLVGLGTLSMVLGTIEYWQSFKDLGRLEEIKFWRPSFIMAMFISVAGVSVFLSIIMRLICAWNTIWPQSRKQASPRCCSPRRSCGAAACIRCVR
jgi:putative membrane protein